MKFWKKIFFLFVLVINSSPALADGPIDKCIKLAQKNEPEVVIKYNYGKLQYDAGKTSDELKSLYLERKKDNSANKITGLTDLSPQLVTSVQVDAELADGNNFCFYPNKIEIKVWYNPVVHIVNSLKPGSCRFNTTIRHEQTHLDLGHHSLYVFAKSLKKAVPQILSAVQPRVEDAKTVSGAKVVEEMTNAYQNEVKKYFEIFKNNLEQYNALIDTAENYAVESRLCSSD